jgi:hypothetical protein
MKHNAYFVAAESPAEACDKVQKLYPSSDPYYQGTAEVESVLVWEWEDGRQGFNTPNSLNKAYIKARNGDR